MAFQPKGGYALAGAPQPPINNPESLDFLVEQIAEAVRQKLLSQGVPPVEFAHHAAPPATHSTGSRDSTHWKSLIHEGAVRIGQTGESPFQPHVLQENQSLASRIDHTLLKPDATPDDVRRMCEEARKHHFATVCVNSSYVGMAAGLLKGSGVMAIAVVGFPLGAAATATKAFETRESVKAGAEEIDMVINIGALKAKEYDVVLDDIAQVVAAAKPHAVKVILETSNLNEDEKIIGSALAKAAGAAFVKTSTGFGSGGATAEDVALMRRIVGPDMGVKASGGIRTYEDASKMIAAGANRIGASASVAIVAESKASGKRPDRTTQPSATPKPKTYKTSLY